MNIGILTFHWATNHGAILQAYALQRYLEENIENAQVMIIDYYPLRYEKTIKRALHSHHPSAIRNNFKELKKEKLLAPFRQKLHKTYRYFSLEQLSSFPPPCDVLISGSDQIWNDFFTMKGEGKPTLSYFLPFQSNARKISYAASFGCVSLSPSMEELIRPHLEKFDAISMRERSGAEIVSKFGLEAKVVCDPTALLPASAYPATAAGYCTSYVARYILRVPNKKMRELIHATERNSCCLGTIRDIEKLPVEKWLGAIRDAEFLVTNSFHGMLFAIKYHTPFVVVMENSNLSGMNDRFVTILSELHLENRIVTDVKQCATLVRIPVDWDQVDALFSGYIAFSQQFLKENCKPLSRGKSISLYKRSECCGCGACVQACPRQCISFERDKEGFVYPSVDENQCIHCGKCDSVCPIKHCAEKKGAIRSTYVAYSRDSEIRQSSSSGGVFSELARTIIAKDGVVFGAVFDDAHHLVQKEATSQAELVALRGSKYVQSDTSGTFERVKHYLREEKTVLFCGTPCQIAGLKKYLNRDYEQLFLVDIICYGVASPKVWEMYIQHLEQQNGMAQTVNFRDKSHGWRKFSLSVQFENGQKCIVPMSQDVYLQLFVRNLSLRPSCYDCSFKGRERESDITIGDAWGIEHFCSACQDDGGATLALVHSIKGEQLFQRAENGLQYIALPANNRALDYNVAMDRSVPLPKERAAFFSALNSPSASLKKLVKRYSKEPFVLAVKKKVKGFLGGSR